MIVLLKLISVTVVWCLGFKIATAEGMLFGKIGERADEKVEQGSIIWKPLVACIYCMPSIHSLFAYAICFLSGMVNFSWHALVLYPVVVAGSSFIAGILSILPEILEKKYRKEDYEGLFYKNAAEKDYLQIKKMKEDYNKKLYNN